MVGISDGKWIVDFETMTCRRVGYAVVVRIEQSGNTFHGKIQDMPMDLLQQWAEDPDGERKLREMVLEAEAVFINAHDNLPKR